VEAALRSRSPYGENTAGVDPAGVDPAGIDTAGELLERWTADGFEYPPSFPTSLTRLRAEIAFLRGDLSAADVLFREAIRSASANGAQVELARSLAGAALLLRHASAAVLRSTGPRADPEELAARAFAIATLTGLDPRVIRLDSMSTAGLGRSATDQPVVVVLITDVVGSTAISRQLGDLAYFELVMRHHELVRSSLRRWSGHEFSESGDGLLAWFEMVGPAVHAALEIQRRAQAAAPLENRLRLKVSLAGGPTLMRAGRPYGLVLNRASRLLDVADPGDIVVDTAVAAGLPSGLGVAATRTAQLRGIGSETITVLEA
jgi:class 3 adenylate cyclase